MTSAFRVTEGMVIGDYRVLRLLGRGGMGEVWEAEQVSLSRRVALKLLLPERVDQKGLEFFAREARAGGRLSHPGIVAIHGTGEDEGLHWIAMELVEEACDLRRSMDAMRDEDELPEDYYRHVADFVAEAAEAVGAAHDAGVIHRDLKPGNILVTSEDRPKISDFGLAKLIDEHSISLAGDLVGTYYYMSPEQVAAKRIGLDHRTDVFSLGVVMYELLTLTRPFDGDTTQQIAQKIMTEDPPAIQSLRSRVPQDLSVICGKMLEKSPDRRYPSMAELAADLRRYLGHEPILAKPPTTVQRGVKWVRRNPATSLVCLFIILLASWSSLVLLRDQRQVRMVREADAVLDELAAALETVILAEFERGTFNSRRSALGGQGGSESRTHFQLFQLGSSLNNSELIPRLEAMWDEIGSTVAGRTHSDEGGSFDREDDDKVDRLRRAGAHGDHDRDASTLNWSTGTNFRMHWRPPGPQISTQYQAWSRRDEGGVARVYVLFLVQREFGPDFDRLLPSF